MSAARVVAAVFAVAALTTVPPANAAPAQVRYVALGDSFAAGSGVFPETDLIVCGRSAVDYPTLIATALHPATFVDATCSGATLDALPHPQQSVIHGVARPQLDWLTPDTTLVTITMGLNDILLANTAMWCINPLPWPWGWSCEDKARPGGHDMFAARLRDLRPAYNLALDQIRARAPQARVVVVGYQILSRPGLCPQQPAWGRDMDDLGSVLGQLNGLLRQVANQHRATYVDIATASVGHDMCATPDQRWINGFFPSSPSVGVTPVHPNSRGEQNMAAQVLATLHRR